MSTNTQNNNKLILYRGFPDAGKHVWSPFVVKLELRLRLAGVRYETGAGSPRSAPRGKIPYVEILADESGGVTTSLGDSTLIIKHLVERGILPDINARLSPTERAQDLAIRALMEEKLYFYHGWERWIKNYYPMRDHVLSSLPYPVRVVVGLLVYRKMTQTLHGQGTGRYTDDEIRSFRREIWEAINMLLVSSRAAAAAAAAAAGSNDQPFWILGGEEPTEADMTVFGFIVSVLLCTAGPESQQLVKGFPAILDYAGRIHDRYFPDYEKFTQG